MTDLEAATTALRIAQLGLTTARVEAERSLDRLHAAIDIVEAGARRVAQLRDEEDNK